MRRTACDCGHFVPDDAHFDWRQRRAMRLDDIDNTQARLRQGVPMSRMFRKSLFALALGVAAVGPVHATDLIVFGDSLSDGGAGIAIANGLCREASFGALACGKKRDSVTL